MPCQGVGVRKKKIPLGEQKLCAGIGEGFRSAYYRRAEDAIVQVNTDPAPVKCLVMVFAKT